MTKVNIKTGEVTPAPVTEYKGTVEPEFPEPQVRITKWFGTKRVDWCWGENPHSWGSGFRHWLEVHPGPDRVIRFQTHGYDSPAYLEYEGKFYTAFTAYWDGAMPIEAPLQIVQGTEV